MNHRTLNDPRAGQGPIERRLRDLSGDRDGPDGDRARRAGAMIRAMGAPPALGPQADSRILAAIRGERATVLSAWFRPRRLLVPGLTLLANVGMGLGAAAAMRWMQPAPPAVPFADLSAASVPPVAVAVASAPTVTLSSSPPPPRHARRSGAGRPSTSKRDFLRARLAIDPRDERHRPEIPPEFARAHAGEVFTWRVQICVSPQGDVSGATVLDEVHPLLDREVGRAIATWKYFPAQHGHHAVHTCAALSYRLALEPPGWSGDAEAGAAPWHDPDRTEDGGD
jgi:hypothetical protein